MRTLLCLLLVGLLWMPLRLSADDGPENKAGLGWLRYDPGTLSDYRIEIEDGDPARRIAVPMKSGSGQAEATKHVMLLIPSRSIEAYSTAVNTILGGFQDRGISAQFHLWFYNKNAAVAEQALAWAYAKPVDLIMSVGSSATSFLKKRHTGHPIPAVTSASKDPVASGHVADAAQGSGSNIAYTSINVETDTLVTYLRRLIPGLTTVGLLYSTANSSAVLTQVNPLKAAAGRLDLNVVDITVSGAGTATDELSSALPAGIAAMRRLDPELTRSLLLVTGSTAVYERIGEINRGAGTLPVVSMLPDIVRSHEDSALLSIGVNLTSALKLSTVYAMDVITGGADPGTLPVGSVSPPDLAINFGVAKKIKIKIPFAFLESATFVYDLDGSQVIAFGQPVAEQPQDGATGKKP